MDRYFGSVRNTDPLYRYSISAFYGDGSVQYRSGIPIYYIGTLDRYKPVFRYSGDAKIPNGCCISGLQQPLSSKRQTARHNNTCATVSPVVERYPAAPQPMVQIPQRVGLTGIAGAHIGLSARWCGSTQPGWSPSEWEQPPQLSPQQGDHTRTSTNKKKHRIMDDTRIQCFSVFVGVSLLLPRPPI
jgi:hypothetical protein